MDTTKIKKKIRDSVTVERVAIAVGAIVVYNRTMNAIDYRMVKPAYATEDRVIFNRPFGGITAVKLDK